MLTLTNSLKEQVVIAYQASTVDVSNTLSVKYTICYCSNLLLQLLDY